VTIAFSALIQLARCQENGP